MAKSDNGLLKTYSKDKWKRIGTNNRAGILAPMFYVHSKNSVGIGDFSDLKLLVDWCSKTGNSILQLLPMNEVGATFCPYDSVSSFALESAYISLGSLLGADERSAKEEIAKIKKAHAHGSSGYVDYGIKSEKALFLRNLYIANDITETDEFEDFISSNSYWLSDFAIFKALKAHHNGRAWEEWEEKYKFRDKAALKAFKSKKNKDIMFEMWVQWQLYKQFKDAKDHAGSKKVLIKGDLPILVSRDSADVWSHPEFFKLQFASGAPPDMYCAKGQRWGMPTYDWDAKSADEYTYLKEKLKYAENFYDILRVDHVVGLFRIWSIPYDEPLENQGLNGSFDPCDESVWGARGREILSIMLDNTKMLLCAEDLGIIPPACPGVLKEMGIPGNDVQRWVKDWGGSHDFLDPEKYRHLSVSMLSTHDTTNWAAWWEDEAGTVDEALFISKCAEKGIDYSMIKDALFDHINSKHGRLKWSNKVESFDFLAIVLGKRPDEIMDLADMYYNTFGEKERLWKHLKIKGPMREKCDSEIVSAALEMALGSNSVFSIQLIVDLLGMGNELKGDPYKYRINTPGTISEKNWSLRAPVSLEEMLEDKVSKNIKAMITASGRCK